MVKWAVTVLEKSQTPQILLWWWLITEICCGKWNHLSLAAPGEGTVQGCDPAKVWLSFCVLLIPVTNRLGSEKHANVLTDSVFCVFSWARPKNICLKQISNAVSPSLFFCEISPPSPWRNTRAGDINDHVNFLQQSERKAQTANRLTLTSPVAEKRSVDWLFRTESTESVTNRTKAIGFLPVLNTEAWWENTEISQYSQTMSLTNNCPWVLWLFFFQIVQKKAIVVYLRVTNCNFNCTHMIQLLTGSFASFIDHIIPLSGLPQSSWTSRFLAPQLHHSALLGLGNWQARNWVGKRGLDPKLK